MKKKKDEKLCIVNEYCREQHVQYSRGPTAIINSFLVRLKTLLWVVGPLTSICSFIPTALNKTCF